MADKVQIYIDGKDGLSPVAKKASGALGGLEKAAAGAHKKLGEMSSGLGSLGTKMTVGLTLPLAGLVAATTKMAMGAVESENLFSVSMGDMEASARAFSESLREQFGLNSYEVRKQIGTWNVMLGSLGMTKDAALGMSESMTQLAYDMASFYNLKPEEAFDKLRAGITGETEPLKRLGIVINETAVEAYALAKGLIKSGQEMSEAQKTAVRYQLIMEQTSKAQGDLARTIESPANQLRIFKDRLTETGIEAGQVFLPMLSGALLWINNEGLPMVAKSINDFKATWTGMSDHAKVKMLVVAGLFVAGGPLLKALSIGIQGIGLFSLAFTRVFARMPKTAAAGIAGALGAILIFHDQITGVVTGIQEMIASLLEFVGKALNKMSGFGAGEGLLETARNYRSWADWAREQNAKLSGVMEEGLSGMAGAAADGALAIGDALIGGLATQVENLGAGLFGPEAEQMWETMNYGASKFAATAVPAVNLTADAFAKLGVPATDAGTKIKKVKEEATDLKEEADKLHISTSDLIGAMIRLHPATKFATQQIALWERRIKDVNLAIQANQDQLKAAQADYGRMGERLGELNDALAAAKQRLSDLSSPRLLGMGALDDTLFGLDQRMKQLQLAKLRAFADPKAQEGIEAQIEALQRQLDIARLQGELRYDKPLRDLKKAAEDSKAEMTYQQALQRIIETKDQIKSLTGEVGAQEAAMRGQQAVIASIQAESERLNQTLQAYQAQLQQAKTNQDLVAQSLQAAYKWLVEDREELAKLGPEGVKQATIVDEQTRLLLKDMDRYAHGVREVVTSNLDAIIKKYEEALATARFFVGQMPSIPAAPTGGGGEAGGGVPYAGNYGGGGVVPGPEGAPAWAIVHGGERIGSGGDIYVTVQVAGNVQAERDLAQTIRRELLLVKRRNGQDLWS